MHMPIHAPDDLQELARRIRREANAKQRDRLRAVWLALQGEPTATIQAMLGRSRGFVQRWCYAYRDHGIEAIAPTPQPGRPTHLPRDQEQALRERLDAGPREADGVCTLRGRDVVRILEHEFGVHYTLQGACRRTRRNSMRWSAYGRTSRVIT